MWAYTQIYKWIKLYSSLEQYTPNSPICPNHQFLRVYGVFSSVYFLQYFLVNFYWRIVTLQCCVSTVKSQLYIYFMYIHIFHVFMYIYISRSIYIFQNIYIYFLFWIFLPFRSPQSAEHSSRALQQILTSYFICGINGVYMSIPCSQFIPLSPHPQSAYTCTLNIISA